MSSRVVSGADERMIVVILLGDLRRSFFRTTPNNLLESAIYVYMEIKASFDIYINSKIKANERQRKRKMWIKMKTLALRDVDHDVLSSSSSLTNQRAPHAPLPLSYLICFFFLIFIYYYYLLRYLFVNTLLRFWEANLNIKNYLISFGMWFVSCNPLLD